MNAPAMAVRAAAVSVPIAPTRIASEAIAPARIGNARTANGNRGNAAVAMQPAAQLALSVPPVALPCRAGPRKAASESVPPPIAPPRTGAPVSEGHRIGAWVTGAPRIGAPWIVVQPKEAPVIAIAAPVRWEVGHRLAGPCCSAPPVGAMHGPNSAPRPGARIAISPAAMPVRHRRRTPFPPRPPAT